MHVPPHVICRGHRRDMGPGKGWVAIGETFDASVSKVGFNAMGKVFSAIRKCASIYDINSAVVSYWSFVDGAQG